MEQVSLASEVREVCGTRKVKRLRSAGLVPAVVYHKGKATHLAVNAKEFAKLAKRYPEGHALINLAIKGDKAKPRTVLLKEIQIHPVTGELLHIAFLEILLTEKIKVKVSMVCKGEAIGVKQGGGILDQVLREIEIECLPTEIPRQLEIDVTQLKIGGGVRVKEITVPAGVKILTDPASTVVHVAAPRAEEVAAPAPAEVTEPEVLKQKKPEEIAAEEEAKAKEQEAKTKEKEEKK